MTSETEANKTDIQISRPVRIPDLVSVIVDLDFSSFPFIKVDRNHPGVTIHSNVDRLPDHVKANSTVHAGKATTAEYTPFGDWPEFACQIQERASQQSDLTFDANMTVTAGADVLGDTVRLSCHGGWLRLDVGTDAGQMNVRYQSDGTVYMTVGFDLPEEETNPREVREGFALPNEWIFEGDDVNEQQVRSLKRLVRGE